MKIIFIFSLFLYSATKHEPDGRVILAEFESLYLLNTYVPNNGWKEDENSFLRRRKWDKRMLKFVVWASDKKPLIWCGDLNVRQASSFHLNLSVLPFHLNIILCVYGR